MGFLVNHTTSTECVVSDYEAVLELLDQWEFTLPPDLRPEGEKEGTLRIFGMEWPFALDREGDAVAAAGGDDDALLDALIDHGEEGFTDFLMKLAPYLLTTFTVQAVDYNDGGGHIVAREWHITPGATAVEEVAFRGFAGDDDAEEEEASQEGAKAQPG